MGYSYNQLYCSLHSLECEYSRTPIKILLCIFHAGLLAYLLDGYQESEYLDPNGIKKTHSKLRLHPALAPVKVAVLSKNDASSDLGRVARQLATELREAGKGTLSFLKVKDRVKGR